MKLRGEAIALGLIFVGPFLLAIAIYFGPFDRSALPLVDNPERELVGGRRTLGAMALRAPDGTPVPEPWADYHWALVYVGDVPCAAACRDHLTRLRQVYDALGHDRERMRPVFLYRGDAPPDLDDARFVFGRLDPAAAEALGIGPGAPPRLYVADPLGNVVLAYPADAEQRGLLEDIERLLDVSRIG